MVFESRSSRVLIWVYGVMGVLLAVLAAIYVLGNDGLVDVLDGLAAGAQAAAFLLTFQHYRRARVVVDADGVDLRRVGMAKGNKSHDARLAWSEVLGFEREMSEGWDGFERLAEVRIRSVRGVYVVASGICTDLEGLARALSGERCAPVTERT